MIGLFGAAVDRLEADVCIVGAGAAGLALAAQFLNTAWRVIVLESGLREPDEMGRELNLLDCVGEQHDGWRDGRVRAFGGTTLSWGGQLLPMRESELAARGWVRGSGWPLDLAELQPYYRRTEAILRTQGPPYDREVWSRLRITPPNFDPARFCVRFSQWAALGRRNFAVLWRRAFEKSRNVSVWLDATAVEVRCSPSGDRCEGIEVRSRGARRAVVLARAYVLACGGIETARLLLASNRACGGVANSSGLVGRFFQDHISYLAGEITPSSRELLGSFFDPRFVGSTMYSVKVEPTDQIMRERAWLNAMGHVAFEVPESLGWMEIRRLLKSLQAGKLELPSLDECLAMARGGLQITRLVLDRILEKRRRAPSAARVLLLVDCEPAPDAESRVYLDGRVDMLGMPRACLDWRVGALERRTLVEFSGELAAEFERLGLARVLLASEPAFGVRGELGAARDIFHHMGTTRMSGSPRDGVTRPDLRCHDVENLYIAGPSVFPASGIANPTFTAIALAIRLADQLKIALSA